MAAYTAMRSRFPALCLVIAPRHVARADEVMEALLAAGLQPVRKSQIGPATPPIRQLVLDTMGELANVYSVADITFVGNSFPPVVKGGGQNLLQPLAHGKPVLVGPYTASIRAELGMAIDARVAFVVADADALAAEGGRLLGDAETRHAVATRARELISANQGVSRRYAQAIADLVRMNLPSVPHPSRASEHRDCG